MQHRLTKHHGLGNDFLVLLHYGEPPFDPASLAVDLCDRRRGVGADGLILGDLGPASSTSGVDRVDLAMVLHNADGSRAEMSGNGIRCLAQAEAMRRGMAAGILRIATDAGVRTVEVGPGGNSSTIMASVDMGPARPGPVPDASADATLAVVSGDEERRLALAPKEQVTVDVGNPHLVLLVEEPEAVDVAAAGPLHEATFAAGINVHFVAPTPGESDGMTMRVWERGVGVTDACGTGAVAVARAARDWSLVGELVTVHMPGGDVRVQVDETMTLIGPATFVAGVEVER